MRLYFASLVDLAAAAAEYVLNRLPGGWVSGRCEVTGRRPCPWHPDGGNHPGVGR